MATVQHADRDTEPASHHVANWQYRAEGGHNLVIVNSQEHVVYRLLKRCKKPNAETEKMTAQSSEQYLQDGINYVKHVIGPKVGERFISPGKLMKLPAGFITAIGHQLEQKRPVHRLIKELDPECQHALCLPDFCQLSPAIKALPSAPTFSVEIKPKCGFLPATNLLLSRTIKYSICKFCLYQPYKLRNGSRKEISSYCPLDLFSGDVKRMRHALNMLFKTPQNNMRLFKNGQLIYSDEVRSEFYKHLQPHFSTQNDMNENIQESVLDNFIGVLVQCLLATEEHSGDGDVNHMVLPPCEQVCQNSIYPTDKTQVTNNGEVKQSSLPYSCVLYQILRLQLLDQYDIESIYPIYLCVKKLFDMDPQRRKASGIDGPYHSGFWEKYSEGDLKKITEFLAAQTAKDCSIIIAIQPCQRRSCSETEIPVNNNQAGDMPIEDHHLIRDSFGHQYQFSLSVIDWDRKPMARISKYFSEEADVIQYFQNVMQ